MLKDTLSRIKTDAIVLLAPLGLGLILSGLGLVIIEKASQNPTFNNPAFVVLVNITTTISGAVGGYVVAVKAHRSKK